jgi:MoaA/NifB/PqqE/SkfB family radical SAM enzyme
MRILQLGTRCNNACIFCATATEREQAVPEPTREALFDALAGLESAEGLAIVGGEPTLYDTLPSLVAHAKHGGVARVIVATNGRRLAYGSYAASLAEAGVDGFDVSLHGSSEAMHDYHTSVQGSYLQTIRGVVNASAAGMGIVITCVVTRSNFRNLSEVLRVARALGVRAVRFRAPELSGRTLARDRIVAHPELVLPHLRRAVGLGRRWGIEVVVGHASHGDFVPVRGDAVEGTVDDRALGESLVQVSGRANPGRQEVRIRERRTGEDLRGILPKLFEPGGKR